MLSCPDTSSSSKDSGSEEVVTLNPTTTKTLKISDHPSWREASSSTISLKPFVNTLGSSELGIEWRNPFKTNASTSYKRKLQLPLLEKNSEGKYVLASKRKSVRFSSPLADDEGENDKDFEDSCKNSNFERGIERMFSSESYEVPEIPSFEDLSNRNSSKEQDMAFDDILSPLQPYLCDPLSLSSLEKNGNNSATFYNNYILENALKHKKPQLNELESPLISNNEATLNFSFDHHFSIQKAPETPLSGATPETPLGDIIWDPEANSESENSFVSMALNSLTYLESTFLPEVPESSSINKFSTLKQVFSCFENLSKHAAEHFIEEKAYLHEQLHSEKVKSEQLLSKMENVSLSLVEIENAYEELRKAKEDLTKENLALKRTIDHDRDKISNLEDKSKALTKKLEDEIKHRNERDEKLFKSFKGLNSLLLIEDYKALKDIESVLPSIENKIMELMDKKQQVDIAFRESKSSKETLLQDLEVKIEKICSLEGEIATLKSELRDSSVQLEEATSLNNEKECVIMRLESDLAISKEQVVSQSLRIVNLETMNRSLKNEVENYESKNKELDIKNEELGDKIIHTERKLEQKERDRLSLQKLVEDSQEQLSMIREKVMALNKQCKIIKEENYELEQISILDSILIEGFEKEKSNLLTRLGILESSIEIKSQKIDLSETRVHFLEKQIESLNQAESERKEKLIDLEDLMMNQKIEFESKEKRFKDFQKQNEEYCDMLIYNIENLLMTLSQNLSEVMEESFISQILETFEIGVETRASVTTSRYFLTTNKIVSEALKYIIKKLQYYLESDVEQAKYANKISEMEREHNKEVALLQKRLDWALEGKHDETELVPKTRRRAVSEKTTHLSKRSHNHSCTTCNQKVHLNEQITKPGKHEKDA